MLAQFPQGFEVRPVTLDDLDTVFQMRQRQAIADYGKSDLSFGGAEGWAWR